MPKKKIETAQPSPRYSATYAPATGRDFTFDECLNELGMPIRHALLDQVAAGRPIPALTLDQIDELAQDFDELKSELTLQAKVFAECNALLIAVTDAHGSIPAGAEQSKRILGRRNSITSTVANNTTIEEDAVLKFKTYLDSIADGLFAQIFSAETKHKLKKGARKVLAAVKLADTKHEKALSLFGRCFDIKPKAATVKVEVIQAEKPAKKARGGKVAA